MIVHVLFCKHSVKIKLVCNNHSNIFAAADISILLTYTWVLYMWELSHVIFLKLRKKELLAKLNKFTK